LVRQKTANLLSIQNLLTRNTGTALSGNRIKTLTEEQVRAFLPTAELALAVTSTLAVMRCVAEQIVALDQAIKAQVALRPAFRHLLTVAGVGHVLALTIMLEAGEMRRFPSVGQWASYGRCVNSIKLVASDLFNIIRRTLPWWDILIQIVVDFQTPIIWID
jgi:transposase